MTQVRIIVQGMSCAHCVKAVKDAVSSLSGVSKIDVSLEKAQAYVEYDEQKTAVEEIISAIEDQGYSAESVN